MKERELETFDKWDRGDKWVNAWDRPNKIPKKELFFGEKFPIKDNFDKRLLKEIDKKFNIAANRDVNFRDLIKLRNDFVPNPRREFELPGTTLQSVGRLLDRHPQEGENGKIRYLLTSGLAVEAITGVTRLHHDTDLVICDASGGWWIDLLTDNVTPDKYWADMKFEPGYLENTAWKATFTIGGREFAVLTVHPAILIVQKLSNAWGRPPRRKDINDVEALFSYWMENLKGDKSWLPIIDKAFKALPNGEERKRVMERLDEILKSLK